MYENGQYIAVDLGNKTLPKLQKCFKRKRERERMSACSFTRNECYEARIDTRAHVDCS